jgi:hypothetical protein
MSDSAPPPPPPSSEPSEPAGTARPAAHSSGSMGGDQMKAAIQGADRLDLGQVGLGILTFIASLLPFYTWSLGPLSVDASAWHGFFGWFGTLLALAAGAVLVAALFGQVEIPSLRVTVLGLFGAATLCMILALFVTPGADFSGSGIDDGRGFGYWLAVLCCIGGTALAFMRKDATD